MIVLLGVFAYALGAVFTYGFAFSLTCQQEFLDMGHNAFRSFVVAMVWPAGLISVFLALWSEHKNGRRFGLRWLPIPRKNIIFLAPRPLYSYDMWQEITDWFSERSLARVMSHGYSAEHDCHGIYFAFDRYEDAIEFRLRFC